MALVAACMSHPFPTAIRFSSQSQRPSERPWYQACLPVGRMPWGVFGDGFPALPVQGTGTAVRAAVHGGARRGRRPDCTSVLITIRAAAMSHRFMPLSGIDRPAPEEVAVAV